MTYMTAQSRTKPEQLTTVVSLCLRPSRTYAVCIAELLIAHDAAKHNG